MVNKSKESMLRSSVDRKKGSFVMSSRDFISSGLMAASSYLCR